MLNKKTFRFILYLFVAYLVVAQSVGAQTNGGGEPTKTVAQQTVRSMAWPAYEGAPAETVSITKSMSQVFRFDRPITRSAISNPAVCDIAPIGGQDVLVNAKEAGTANLLVWDNANNIATYNLDSTLNLEKLNHILLGIDPTAQLKVIPFWLSVPQSCTLPPKQKAVSLPAFATGMASTVTETESVSEHIPFIPMTA